MQQVLKASTNSENHTGLIGRYQSSLAALYRILDSLLILGLLLLVCQALGQRFDKDWLIVGLLAAMVFAFMAYYLCM